ncbi:hypothetical protein PT273_03225 [Orbaceae bacterium ESL0727]|nr:hypothetical protein [Orbaceae bacterium ESL0727]
MLAVDMTVPAIEPSNRNNAFLPKGNDLLCTTHTNLLIEIESIEIKSCAEKKWCHAILVAALEPKTADQDRQCCRRSLNKTQ